ncbi:UDP-glycosyltransferase 85A2 [Morus notabilis]|uniref:UDP-glycosyltransferase 85A2 n=2 Tax=Morus notabilis TaxID=981085 RepID=W9QVD7_9ROSA|nr:UDP-glycosyltransferase 85A2 [Morus notabilis]
MSFSLKAAEEFGVPFACFWTTSACGFMGYVQYRHLVDKGLIPLKDETYLSNGYLDTIIDWIPGMKDIRLRDLPSFIRTTNPDDIMINIAIEQINASSRASAIIVNTFDVLEHKVLESLSSIFPRIYTVGPLHLPAEKTRPNSPLSSIGSNLWKEESQCLQWLNSKQLNSVVYVNFGSITVMTRQQLIEFAWGLSNSKKPFVWIIRPDLVADDSGILPPEFVEETRERGVLAGWCPQETMLRHPSVGGFLTHCGWNSTIESLTTGVPIVCWPFFAEQQTNCRFSCGEWSVGMEIDSDVKREKVEKLVRELMDGEKGKEMRRNALEWKRKAEEATEAGGSSLTNFEKLIEEVLLFKNQLQPY